MDYAVPQYHKILLRLADEGVEFIGVGMVAAIPYIESTIDEIEGR